MSRQTNLIDGETCFITTTITGWADIFTGPGYRHIMVDSLNYCVENKDLSIFAWCLMSNHLHLIARCEQGTAINHFMRDFKKYTSRQIAALLNNSTDGRKKWLLSLFRYAGLRHHKNVEYKVWQDDFDCFELWSEPVFEQKLNYIHNNPVKAELVTEPQHWLYSSARDYAGEKGLVKVVIA